VSSRLAVFNDAPYTYLKRLNAVTATLAILVALLCANDSSPEQLPDDAAIVVPAGAQNVRYAEIYDGQVTYELSESYPAQKTIEHVHATLKRLGWRLRERDFLNPSIQIVQTATWREVKIRDQVVTVWSEQWENSDGDVVWYGYDYSPLNGQNSDPRGPLRVIVSHFRAPLVRAMATVADSERTEMRIHSPPDTEHSDVSPKARTEVLSPTLQFDTEGAEFGAWVRGFVRLVRQNWTQPTTKRAARVVVWFNVDKQGTLASIGLVEKAEDDALNQAVIKALFASSGGVPLPPEFPKDSLRVTATFDYGMRSEGSK
jgi:TonB C terminal